MAVSVGIGYGVSQLLKDEVWVILLLSVAAKIALDTFRIVVNETLREDKNQSIDFVDIKGEIDKIRELRNKL